MDNKIKLFILIIIILVVALIVIAINSPNQNIIENVKNEEEVSEITFSLEDFNPIWVIFTGYRCGTLPELTIQGNLENSLRNVDYISYQTYFDCTFKSGDYERKINTVSNDVSIGDFDVS